MAGSQELVVWSLPQCVRRLFCKHLQPSPILSNMAAEDFCSSPLSVCPSWNGLLLLAICLNLNIG